MGILSEILTEIENVFASIAADITAWEQNGLSYKPSQSAAVQEFDNYVNSNNLQALIPLNVQKEATPAENQAYMNEVNTLTSQLAAGTISPQVAEADWTAYTKSLASTIIAANTASAQPAASANPYTSLPINSTINGLAFNSFGGVGGDAGQYYITASVNTSNSNVFQGLQNGIYMITSATKDFSDAYATVEISPAQVYANPSGTGGQINFNESFGSNIVPVMGSPFYVMLIGTIGGVKGRSHILTLYSN